MHLTPQLTTPKNLTIPDVIRRLQFAPQWAPERNGCPDNEALHDQVVKLQGCSKSRWLCQSQDRLTARVCIRRCKSRICPTCIHRRRAAVAANLAAAAKCLTSRQFLTLTLASTDEPLDVQLRFAMKCFAKLRRTKFWKRYVRGGFYNLQVTWNQARYQFHPHIHAITESVFIPFEHEDNQGNHYDETLPEVWEKITKGSRICWIENLKNIRQGAGSLVGYITTPDDLMKLPPEKLPEWIRCTKSLRAVSTFGRLHGMEIPEEELPEREPLERVCDLNPIIAAAEAGEPEAVWIATAAQSLFNDHRSIDHAELIRRAIDWTRDRGGKVVNPRYIKNKAESEYYKFVRENSRIYEEERKAREPTKNIGGGLGKSQDGTAATANRQLMLLPG